MTLFLSQNQTSSPLQSDSSPSAQRVEKPIPKSKFRLHEARCLRNTVKCSKCGKAIDKGMLEEHMDEMHSKQKCAHCGFEADKDKFGMHEQSCSLKPIVCEYCEQSITTEKYLDHLESCGNKTRKCEKCTNFVKIKDWKAHEAMSDCSHLKPKPKPVPRDDYRLPGQEDDLGVNPPNRFAYPRSFEPRGGVSEENKTAQASRFINPAPRTQIQRNPVRNTSSNATTSSTAATRALPTRSNNLAAKSGSSSHSSGQRSQPRAINPAPQSSLLSQTGSQVARGPSSRAAAAGGGSTGYAQSRYSTRSSVKQNVPPSGASSSTTGKTVKQANYGYPDNQPRMPVSRGPSKISASSRAAAPKPKIDDLDDDTLRKLQAQWDEEDAHKIAMSEYSGNYEAPKPEVAFKPPEQPKPRYPGIPQNEPDFTAPNEYPMAPSAAPGFSGGYAYSYASGPGSEGEINQLPSSQQFMNAAGSASLYDSGFAVAQEDPLLQQALEESLKQEGRGMMDATVDSDDWKRVIELSKREK